MVQDGARINELPDEILVGILCFLSLEEAIRTTVLSRRWKNLWMNVPKLEFCWRNKRFPYDFRPRDMSKVKAKVNFVNDVMKLHETTTTSIEELTICLPLGSKYSDDIDKWVEVAAVKRVEKLKLDFGIGDLATFIFVDVVDKAIECLFSNSPLIERLCLRYSQKLHKLEVADAPSLKYLEIVYCDHLQHFHISAPNLNTIRLFVRSGLVRLNLYAPSLCHASLGIQHFYMNLVCDKSGCAYNMFDYLVEYRILNITS
ncbi:hypothetical protein FNV43_RR20904 [Rhamnella rubrinervis]|uniref:F-box domain-containing protein n=1 Tax=Rhamnella rubrinervis TaxID=2594499 RepID=A0A8K0GUZ9_9ROSA|nr:hypothetical protein FNV43_RR20904 [Rhamnella rubrinervis]